MNLTLQGLSCSLPFLQDTLCRLQLCLQHHFVLQVSLQTSRFCLADGELLAALPECTSKLLFRQLCQCLHAKFFSLQCLLGSNACCNLLLIAHTTSHAHLKFGFFSGNPLVHKFVLGLQTSLVAIFALPEFLNLQFKKFFFCTRASELSACLLLAGLHFLFYQFGLQCDTLTTLLLFAYIYHLFAKFGNSCFVSLQFTQNHCELSFGLALCNCIFSLLCHSLGLGTSKGNLLGLSLLGLVVSFGPYSRNLVLELFLLVGGFVFFQLC